ncbi:CobW family GTP-binding protein [Thermodesulfobacteriota bacterium]
MKEEGIKVYLISGFLGSGKTTFLNRLLKRAPEDLRLMILMNEFGEEGIDGTLIEDPELDMIEISRGSIFCACVKGDYIKALYRIAFTIKPEVLVMEASGVANPTDLSRDLATPIFKNAFAEPINFCLVDAAYFLEQYEIFYALEKQITSTNHFIINKVDQADPDVIKRVKEVIISHNPEATFTETTYAEVDLSEVFGLKEKDAPVPEPEPAETLLTEDDLEHVIDDMLTDQAAQVAPPDRLSSLSCRWHSGTVEDFRFIAERLPEDVVRAKGFLFEDGKTYLYSHVGRTFELEPHVGRMPDRVGVNRAVFIRRGFEQDDILALFADRGLKLLE